MSSNKTETPSEEDTAAMSGRVTIFALQTCPHCKKAKSLLTEYDVEYYEISLTSYPEKRTDMLKLTDRLTVPQIFFDDQHIGGASDLEQLHTEGKLQAMVDALAASSGPTEEKLTRPDYEPKQEELLEVKEQSVCIGDQCVTYAEMSAGFAENLPIKDRRYHLITYKRCFKGTDLVDYLMANYDIRTRQEAVQVGKSLNESRVLDHVVHEHPFEDGGYFYRLTIHNEPNILNNFKIWDKDDVSTEDPIKLVKNCKKLYTKVAAKHTDGEGMIDFIGVLEDEEYVHFKQATCEFQRLDLAAMSYDMRLAFIINVYNLCINQAFAQVGTPRSGLQKLAFFDAVKIDIGGQLYSFNALENGILRSNQVPPAHLRKPFGTNDPRIKNILPRPPIEPRIHFALNCGAKSCPPIKNFTAEAVQEELRINSMAFLEEGGGNLAVDVEKKTLWLTKIVSWYHSDFGKTNKDVAETLLPFLRGDNKTKLEALVAGGKFKIRYFKYDWSNVAKTSKKFGKNE